MTYAEAAAKAQRLTAQQRNIVMLNWVVRYGVEPDRARDEMRKLLEFNVNRSEEKP